MSTDDHSYVTFCEGAMFGVETIDALIASYLALNPGHTVRRETPDSRYMEGPRVGGETAHVMRFVGFVAENGYTNIDQLRLT